jgi:hypothetical protein
MMLFIRSSLVGLLFIQFSYSLQVHNRGALVNHRKVASHLYNNDDNNYNNDDYKIISKSWKAIVISAMSSLLVLGSAFDAHAGLFTSYEQDVINEISSFQRPVAELYDQLKPSYVPNAIGVYSNTQVLKGGKDDSDVVLLYLEGYIKPCQIKMEKISKLIQLPTSEEQKKIEVLPLLMKGHIAELTQAIQIQKADFQAREVQEVQETLADFLKLVSVKYTVQPYIPIRPLSDSELFGPLGCEFWGKKRVVGSNQCIVNE